MSASSPIKNWLYPGVGAQKNLPLGDKTKIQHNSWLLRYVDDDQVDGEESMRYNLSASSGVNAEEVASELNCLPYSVQHHDEGVCVFISADGTTPDSSRLWIRGWFIIADIVG